MDYVNIPIAKNVYSQVIAVLGKKSIEQFLAEMTGQSMSNKSTGKRKLTLPPEGAWGYSAMDPLEYEDMVRGERPE